jgi:hypothetical protein
VVADGANQHFGEAASSAKTWSLCAMPEVETLATIDRQCDRTVEWSGAQGRVDARSGNAAAAPPMTRRAEVVVHDAPPDTEPTPIGRTADPEPNSEPRSLLNGGWPRLAVHTFVGEV